MSTLTCFALRSPTGVGTWGGEVSSATISLWTGISSALAYWVFSFFPQEKSRAAVSTKYSDLSKLFLNVRCSINVALFGLMLPLKIVLLISNPRKRTMKYSKKPIRWNGLYILFQIQEWVSMIEILLPFLQRHGLWYVILACQDILPVLIGLAVFIGPTADLGNGPGPVAVDVLLGSGPFQGIGLPRVLRTALAIEYAHHKVIGEYQFRPRGDQREHRHEHLDIGQLIKKRESGVLVVPPGYPGHA